MLSKYDDAPPIIVRLKLPQLSLNVDETEYTQILNHYIKSTSKPIATNLPFSELQSQLKRNALHDYSMDTYDFIAYLESNNILPIGSMALLASTEGTQHKSDNLFKYENKLIREGLQKYPILGLVALLMSNTRNNFIRGYRNQFVYTAMTSDDIDIIEGTHDDLRIVLANYSRTLYRNSQLSFLRSGLFISDNPLVNLAINTTNPVSTPITPLLEWAMKKTIDPSFNEDPTPLLPKMGWDSLNVSLNDLIDFDYIGKVKNPEASQLLAEIDLICSALPRSIYENYNRSMEKLGNFAKLFKGK